MLREKITAKLKYLKTFANSPKQKHKCAVLEIYNYRYPPHGGLWEISKGGRGGGGGGAQTKKTLSWRDRHNF